MKLREHSKMFRGLLLVGLAMVAQVGWAAGPTIKILYRFHGNDGAYPAGRLLPDASGNLFSTTASGGPRAQGVVFELAPSSGGVWNESLLRVRLGLSADGPFGGLVVDADGNFFGTTLGGGPFVGGTVFELSPPSAPGGAWIFTVLHAFEWGKDGARPYGGLVFDAAGNLYGTTAVGGGSTHCNKMGLTGCGTVFQLVAPAHPGGAWTENVIHRFEGSPDGSTPVAGLAIDGHGNLFGTTIGGGAFNGGAVFELAPPAALAAGASEPRPFLPVASGNAGSVFELAPPAAKGGAWTETILHAFSGGDGAFPYAGVTLDAAGNLYGATSGGGNFGCAFNAPCGLVFQLQPPVRAGDAWTENVLYEFPAGSLQGANPYGGVVLDGKGNLYGTTELGGFIHASSCNYGCGVVFQLTPPGHGSGAWTESVLYEFKGGGDGADPAGDLILDSKGRIYGTAEGGNPGGGTGTVFRITP